uniref:Uncharacterized protein n=1 Tax=Ditylenchus dipsaci TaxID=166011 RepID=A0A915CU83_9BILA
VGMRNFHVRNNQHYSPTINLDKIWPLVTEETRQKYADVTDKVPGIISSVPATTKCLGKDCRQSNLSSPRPSISRTLLKRRSSNW